MPGWNSTHMVGNPTTLQKARQGGWNSNHLPYCLLCGCLIKKLQTLRFTCRPIQESDPDHLVVGEVTSPAQQMVISTNTFWFIPEKNCIRCTTTSPSILHKSAQSSEERLEKQILATKSHSSNDLFSSVVLLLQVIFFSILFNVCDISELVSFNYLPQPCFFVFDNPTLAINIIHCGMNRLPFLLHLVKAEESFVLLNNFWEHKSQNVPFWGNVSIWKEDWPDFAPLFAKFFYILHTFIVKVIATVP